MSEGFGLASIAASCMNPNAQFRELKVIVPARLAVAMHSKKILTGRPIRDVVEEALRAYFAKQDESGGLPLELTFDRDS